MARDGLAASLMAQIHSRPSVRSEAGRVYVLEASRKLVERYE